MIVLTPLTFAQKMDIHIQGFEKVLNEAERNNIYKYGIYSSRILAVHNPEIYLQSDMLFTHLITTELSYKKAFESGKLLNGTEMGWGDPFNFDLVNFKQKNIISPNKFYNKNYPVFNFLDRRFSSIHTTLKLNNITGVEAANLIYLKQRINGSPLDQTYLIVTRSNDGFVYSRGNFYNAYNQIVKKDKINDPILIFNERYVWYPLMDRNDTNENKTLDMLVNKLSTKENKPILTKKEKKFIARLINVSSIQSDNKPLAILSAVHAGNNFKLHFDKYKDLWFRENVNLDYSILQDFLSSYKKLLAMKIGNYLSPNTAYLSSLINENNINFEEITNEYLKYVGSKQRNSDTVMAWGHTWYCGVIENNIDDAFRTNGGHCLSQAINLSSVLDLSNIANIFINGKFYRPNSTKSNSHAITLIPNYNTTFNNGKLIPYEDYMFNKILIKSAIMNNVVLSFSPSNIGYYGKKKIAKNISKIIIKEAKEFNPLSFKVNQKKWYKINKY